jgi:hypothetical protein
MRLLPYPKNKEHIMHKFTSKTLGRLSLAIGILIAVAAVFLFIFFIGYFNDIEWLYIFGPSTDVLNLTTSILTCVMAVILLPSPKKQPLLFVAFLILVLVAWVGAAIVTVDSLVWGGMMTNLTVQKMRLLYGLGFITNHDSHFGSGLIGLWLIAMNLFAYTKKRWPSNIIILGVVSGVLYSLGLVGLSFILFGGISQIVWNILLGCWILGKSRSEATTLS